VGETIEWIECPARTADWIERAAWERIALPGLLRRRRIDLLLMASGTVLPRSPVPQAALAMNPGVSRLTPGAGIAEGIKAALQRRAYRRPCGWRAWCFTFPNICAAAYEANASRKAVPV